MSAVSSYDFDLYEWTKEQADALRRRASNALDWDNLAEEIESLGNSNLDQIESRSEILILHLLKWKYQPEWQCGSWRGSIFEARRRIARICSNRTRRCDLFPANICPRPIRPRARRPSLKPAFTACPDLPWTIEQILA